MNSNQKNKPILETEFVSDEIAKCEDLDEFKDNILPKLYSQRVQWANKIDEIFKENGYNKSQFAKDCGLTRQAVHGWTEGKLPKSREHVLRIGLLANYSVEEMNHFLQRYGRYPALYSKSLEDCICIYVINHYDGVERIEKFKYILNKIKEKIIIDDNVYENVSTRRFDKKLAEVHDDEELDRFIRDNISVFASSYNKLYAYVKMNIFANYMEPSYASSVFEMAEIQGWSSSLRQCVSAIRKNKWYPTRKKIISLGLHLCMDHEQVDDMLKLAKMEPLYSKNILESVIIYILESASINDMLNKEVEGYDPDELCEYAREIMSSLGISEVEDFISELPEVEDAW